MNPNKRKLQRGEIYLYYFGDNPGDVFDGVKPVLILQERYPSVNSASVLIAPIASDSGKKYLSSHVPLSVKYGVEDSSVLMMERIISVPKRELLDYVGKIVDESIWRSINCAVKKLFGLWTFKTDSGANIRCLCGRCLRDYMYDSTFIVRRVDPLNSKKEHCFKCDNMGYIYMIFDKRKGV